HLASAIATIIQARTTGVGQLHNTGAAANTYTSQPTVAEGTLDLAMSGAVNALVTGTLVVGDFSGTDTLKVTTGNAQMGSVPVIVNASGTLDISGSSTAQTIGNLDVRGGTVKT